ncbi:MAG: hypothetical protein OXE41_03950 [Gammaproteobacteria bacterium]|nr:hypothetical protein [Gammaproteobacteria bacterium]MCY4219197.1 hypothetical protein [Gammaproteobacteria bacterium]MCY4274538.1 hypothetical protein [Gammaproteobacteria bacterium]
MSSKLPFIISKRYRFREDFNIGGAIQLTYIQFNYSELKSTCYLTKL